MSGQDIIKNIHHKNVDNAKSIVCEYNSGVYLIIDKSHFDPVIITCFTDKGDYESAIYNCSHKPIFGYDVEDWIEMDKIIKGMIKRYANNNMEVSE